MSRWSVVDPGSVTAGIRFLLGLDHSVDKGAQGTTVTSSGKPSFPMYSASTGALPMYVCYEFSFVDIPWPASYQLHAVKRILYFICILYVSFSLSLSLWVHCFVRIKQSQRDCVLFFCFSLFFVRHASKCVDKLWFTCSVNDRTVFADLRCSFICCHILCHSVHYELYTSVGRSGRKSEIVPIDSSLM